MVQTWVGGTFVDVRLAVRSCKSNLTGANVSTDHVFAGASVHAGVGLALVVVDVTVSADPARVAEAPVAVDLVFAVAVDAGVTEALVDLGEARGVVVPLGTDAGEAVDAVDAGAPIVAGVDGALVDVDVAHGSGVARFTGAFIAIDFVDAGPVVTRVAFTVVNVNFTVDSSSAFGTVADVQVLPVLTCASVSTRLAQTLIDVGLTEASSVARFAEAAEGGQAVHTGAVVTRRRVALIDVRLTVFSCVAFSAFTCVLVGPICALGAVFAGRAGTLVDVDLAQVSREACGALAEEVVDLVDAFSVVKAGAAGALVCVHFTVLPLVSWHADALEISDLIQAGGFVHAGV